MPRDKSRKHVSISGATYQRLVDYADQHGTTVTSVVADATSEPVEHNELLVLPASLKRCLVEMAERRGVTIAELLWRWAGAAHE